MSLLEPITWKGQSLGLVIRAEMSPDRTTFLTAAELPVQVGFVVYPEGGRIGRHAHLDVHRQVVGTFEVLVVRRGRCEVDCYGADRELVATYELRAGDVLLMTGGGHAFRLLEDTVFLEIKQGPYLAEEKEPF